MNPPVLQLPRTLEPDFARNQISHLLLPCSLKFAKRLTEGRVCIVRVGRRKVGEVVLTSAASRRWLSAVKSLVLQKRVWRVEFRITKITVRRQSK